MAQALRDLGVEETPAGAPKPKKQKKHRKRAEAEQQSPMESGSPVETAPVETEPEV